MCAVRPSVLVLTTYYVVLHTTYTYSIDTRAQWRDAASGLRQLAESVESCCLVDRYSPSWPEAALIVILITVLVQYCECGPRDRQSACAPSTTPERLVASFHNKNSRAFQAGVRCMSPSKPSIARGVIARGVIARLAGGLGWASWAVGHRLAGGRHRVAFGVARGELREPVVDVSQTHQLAWKARHRGRLASA